MEGALIFLQNVFLLSFFNKLASVTCALKFLSSTKDSSGSPGLPEESQNDATRSPGGGVGWPFTCDAHDLLGTVSRRSMGTLGKDFSTAL